MATGPTGTGSKVLTLGMCGVAPAGPQRAVVTRGPVACGGVWAKLGSSTILISIIKIMFILINLCRDIVRL